MDHKSYGGCAGSQGGLDQYRAVPQALHAEIMAPTLFTPLSPTSWPQPLLSRVKSK